MRNRKLETKNKKFLNDLIRKSIKVILFSRLSLNNSQLLINELLEPLNQKLKLTEENRMNEIDDYFLDDYSSLREFNKINQYILEISYQSKEFEILIERWTFQYYDDNKSDDSNKNIDNFIQLKLRSVYTLCRLLPAFTFCDKKEFNYNIKYRLFSNMKLQKSFIDNVKINKVSYKSKEMHKFEIKIEYLNKNDIIESEEKFFKSLFDKMINKTFSLKKQRYNSYFLTENCNEHFKGINYLNDYFNNGKLQLTKKNINHKEKNNNEIDAKVYLQTDGNVYSSNYSNKVQKTNDSSNISCSLDINEESKDKNETFCDFFIISEDISRKCSKNSY